MYASHYGKQLISCLVDDIYLTVIRPWHYFYQKHETGVLAMRPTSEWDQDWDLSYES